MTYYIKFSSDYAVCVPPGDMLTVEADNPQAAMEQVLRDGNLPEEPRMRTACVVSMIQSRPDKPDKAMLFWIDFDGQPRQVGGEIHWR